MRSELNALKKAYVEFEAQLVGVSDKVRTELEKVLDAVPDAFEMKTIVARLKGVEQEIANIAKRHASEDAARDRKPVVVGAVAGVLAVLFVAAAFWLQLNQLRPYSRTRVFRPRRSRL